MVKVSKVTVPAQTTVLLVEENEDVIVTFETLPVSIGGLSDLSNASDRIAGGFLAQKQLAIPKGSKLYGYYTSPSGSQEVSMLIISVD